MKEEIVLNDTPSIENIIRPKNLEKNDKVYFSFLYTGEQGAHGAEEIYLAVDKWNKEIDSWLYIKFSLEEMLDFMIKDCLDAEDKNSRILLRKTKRQLLKTVEDIKKALKTGD